MWRYRGVDNMNIYEKITAIKVEFHSKEIKKTGINSFSKTEFFQLGDFVTEGIRLCNQHKLCQFVNFDAVNATMTIVNSEKPEERVVYNSPMSTCNLKGMHEVQNLGAVQTYLRRYLWQTFLEVAEHDEVDMSSPIERTQNFSDQWQPKIDEAVTQGWASVIALFKDIPESVEKKDYWIMNKSFLMQKAGKAMPPVGKQPISDERLEKAMAKIADGTYTADKLSESFELTDEQKTRVYGK